MNKNNLLASIALFGELYNKSDKKENLSDILADFIKGAVSFEQKYNLNSTELKDLLTRVYGFDNIPESVIRTIVGNRLKSCVTKNNGYYHFNSVAISDQKTISDVYEINKKQEEIVKLLFDYIIAKRPNSNLTEELVWNKLSSFLMDNDYSDEYSEFISAYIISNNNQDFNVCLNTIKEGLVLYNGLCFSGDISQLGSWKDELTIYLSPEHLFNCIGYNGIIFKEIFDDFMNLVKEINRSEKGQNKKGIIHLKYFEETKKEIDKFFEVAELIKKGTARLDPTKPAMVEIVNTCKNIEDIKRKQASFYVELKRLGIILQDYSYNGVNAQYNIFDSELIAKLKSESIGKNKFFDEEYCEQCLQMFSKINYFRKGTNNLSFEKIKHIYMTENRFAIYLGHNTNVKFNSTDASFAKDIDYIITKFWFKLKKGFNNNDLPKTFDVVVRAKIIMSSRIANSLSESYEKLKTEFREKKLTEEEAIVLNDLYKEKPLLPENINPSNIDDSLDFLDNKEYLENFLREKTRKETQYQETEKENGKLKEELNKYKRQEEERSRNQEVEKLNNDCEIYALTKWKNYRKNNFCCLFYSFMVLFWTILPISVGLLLKLIRPMNEWFDSLSCMWQIIIWVILVIVFAFEIIGRSYLFKKERIKDGWGFLWTIISMRYNSLKNEQIECFKHEYAGGYMSQKQPINTII